MQERFRAVLGAGLTCLASATHAQALTGVDTPRRPVTEVYHGKAVSEDYRWLEAIDTAEVQDWIAQQNARTRAALDTLPARSGIRDELDALIGRAPTTRRGLRYVAGRLFAMKRSPSVDQPVLVVRLGADDAAAETVVVDPNRLNPKGTTTIDWFEPSLDGKTVAVSLSDNGSEDGALHFFDVATGRALPDVVPRVQYPTGGGSVAWAPGNRGVYYTRYPQGKERAPEDANFYQQVWFHQLGTAPDRDRYVIGRDLPRIAEIALSSSEDGRYLLADVANGDGGEHAYRLRSPDGRWHPISGFADGVRHVQLGRDGRWYALVLKDSPRGRIVAGSLANPRLASARVVVPEGGAVIDGFTPTQRRLYVEMMVGGPTELHAFALNGRLLGRIGNESIATVYVGAALAGDAILFGSQSFVSPFAWYRFAPSAAAPMPAAQKTRLSEAPSDVRLDDVEVVREFARSRDGTQVPLNVMRRKGLALDGSHPVLLYGYGGYGISMQPWFLLRNVFWLRHGGVFVQANLRGGGEFGEAWHLAGNLTRKQNVFDDFIAGAQALIERGYTTPTRLAIEGGSNGGLLMGAAVTQRPDLFKAVVSHVGIYDSLRAELSPNGEFNTTEFGSVKDPAQFEALHAYSPYHRVVDGTAYPAMLLLTGMNDGRVEPHQSLKMAARLQAANASNAPVLLRVAGDAGHGQGMAVSSVVAQDADVFAFLFDQLGMK